MTNTRIPDELFFGVSAPTPQGLIWVAVSTKGLAALQIGGTEVCFLQGLAARFEVPVILSPSRVDPIIRQIEAYLDGTRQTFEIPIYWELLSPFQQKALHAVCAIPYGETRTYGQLAAQIGAPRAARAVGRANATNPMPLVIPCHRLMGADGSLRGYGSGQGLTTKRWLLNLEDRHVKK